MADPTFSAARLSLRRSMTAKGMALRESLAPASSDRPTILYIHGLGESAFCFEDLLASPRLASWHQLAPDLLGYGKSLWTPEPLDLEGHAHSLLHWLDSLEIGWVALVGHSMGGVIGTHLARLLGPRVAGFINIEGNLSPEDCVFSGRVAAIPLEDWLDQGHATFLRGLRDLVCEEPSAEVERSEVLGSYAASIQMADPRVFHKNSGDLVAISSLETLASTLATFDFPTLYVHGAPRGTGARSLALLEQAGVPTRRIEDAGHWPFLDQPAAFLDTMTYFLEGLGP